MKRFNKIGASFLIVIFLLGTIGITTYNHYCSVDGESISYFIPTEHTCNDEMVSMASMETEEHDCCKKDETVSKVKLSEDDCCHDVVKSYKVSDQYNLNASPNKVVLSFISIPLHSIFQLFNNEQPQNVAIVVDTQPPLHRKGLDMLRMLRIWRL